MSGKQMKEIEDEEFLTLLAMQRQMEQEAMLNKQASDFLEMIDAGYEGDFEDFLAAGHIE